MHTGDIPGIRHVPVTDWLHRQVPSLVPPLAFSLITGGHSNLTYKVSDQAGSTFVLRRPPLGHVLDTAHDMGREHRIIAALQDTAVPVPPLIGMCADAAVNDAPFYVMSYVDGTVIRNEADAASLSPEQRMRASESLVDVLVALHEVDVAAVGLADLARHDSYIERQLKRWYGQFKSSVESAQITGLESVDEAHATLSAHIPLQQGVAIVHGDYRLDNTMLGTTGEVAAVLDWEICTLGDPLADLGLLLVYWTDPDVEAALPQASPTALEGFLRSDQVLARYSERSSRDLSEIDFYVAFGWWKLTCIIAGVYARYAAGAMGEVPQSQVQAFEQMVHQLAGFTTEAVNVVVAQ